MTPWRIVPNTTKPTVAFFSIRRIPMRLRFLALTLTLSGLYASLPGQAQTPPAANPLDDVPDSMPFDVPYGAPITLQRAEAVIVAAVSEAKKHNWKLNVAVVDSGANLVAFQRMDGAQLASISVSQHKARAAASFRRETRAFEDNVQLKQNYYLLTLDGIIASRGGIPLIVDGKLIGAIGCSGGTGSQDEMVCKAGAASLK
jgi:glc operon protein GlcG